MIKAHIYSTKIFLIWRTKIQIEISSMKNLMMSFLQGNKKRLSLILIILLCPAAIFASDGSVPMIGPIRVEFIIFGLILLGVALFHKQTFWVAVIGLTVLLTFKFIFDPAFHLGEHMFGTTPLGEQIME
jgi:hypothetical protein